MYADLSHNTIGLQSNFTAVDELGMTDKSMIDSFWITTTIFPAKISNIGIHLFQSFTRALMPVVVVKLLTG